jgi:hypothetical protein
MNRNGKSDGDHMSLPVAPFMAPWLLLVGGGGAAEHAPQVLGPVVMAAFYDRGECVRAGGKLQMPVTYLCVTREWAREMWPEYIERFE